mmetsp:Transcript_11366/g.26232  ORF Transcript_11366/g.26232 Transcript_11366/m.26232 type:complete len:260 (+) Transcript_11366:274-1053(+)
MDLCNEGDAGTGGGKASLPSFDRLGRLASGVSMAPLAGLAGGKRFAGEGKPAGGTEPPKPGSSASDILRPEDQSFGSSIPTGAGPDGVAICGRAAGALVGWASSSPISNGLRRRFCLREFGDKHPSLLPEGDGGPRRALASAASLMRLFLASAFLAMMSCCASSSWPRIAKKSLALSPKRSRVDLWSTPCALCCNCFTSLGVGNRLGDWSSSVRISAPPSLVKKPSPEPQWEPGVPGSSALLAFSMTSMKVSRKLHWSS